MNWHEAIQKVLMEEGPLNYLEITRLISERGYKTTEGATPEATVSAYITSDIKKDPSKSKYIKLGRGVYGLNINDVKIKKESVNEIDENEIYDSIIHSYGMFWNRDKVLWKSNPDIFGFSQIGSSSINFARQIGIYLLYDGREVVYVGQAIKQPIGERLFQHTIDRLSGRWDRFSWFGLYSVREDGDLKIIDETNRQITISDLGDTLEAVLIEALEPRQNRKKGNNFSGIEYIQSEDPEIKRKRAFQLIDELKGKI